MSSKDDISSLTRSYERPSAEESLVQTNVRMPRSLYERMRGEGVRVKKSIAWLVEDCVRRYFAEQDKLSKSLDTLIPGKSEEVRQGAIERYGNPHYAGHNKDKRMQALLVLSNLADTRTDIEKCSEIGISVSCMWRWKNDPTFSDELQRLIDVGVLAHRDRVFSKLIKQAVEEENLLAMKLYLTITGDYVMRSQSMNLNIQSRSALSELGSSSIHSPREKQLYLAKVLSESGFSIEEYRQVVDGDIDFSGA
jgi:hypothetical protein